MQQPKVDFSDLYSDGGSFPLDLEAYFSLQKLSFDQFLSHFGQRREEVGKEGGTFSLALPQPLHELLVGVHELEERKLVRLFTLENGLHAEFMSFANEFLTSPMKYF